MKYLQQLLFTLAMCVCFSQMTYAQTVSLEFDNAETAANLINSYIDGMDNLAVNTVMSTLSPEAIIFSPGGDTISMQAHKASLSNLFSLYDYELSEPVILPVKVTDSPIAGEYVCAWGTCTLTLKATGQKVQIDYHTLSVVSNGKIVWLKPYYDELSTFQKLGYTLKEPGM